MAVNNAFQNLSPQCLRFVFITLQACMIEVMKRQGGFDYHIPHMNKTKAAREGTLPDYLSIEKQLVVDSLQHLFTKLSTDKMNQLVQLIGYAGGLIKGLCKSMAMLTLECRIIRKQQQPISTIASLFLGATKQMNNYIASLFQQE